MKKLLAITLLSFPLLCNAEAFTLTFEAVCDETKVLVKKLVSQYKEIPLITGDTGDEAGSTMSLWVNTENNSWTILATKENLSCVIGYGENFKVIPYQKSKRT